MEPLRTVQEPAEGISTTLIAPASSASPPKKVELTAETTAEPLASV